MLECSEVQSIDEIYECDQPEEAHSMETFSLTNIMVFYIYADESKAVERRPRSLENGIGQTGQLA